MQPKYVARASRCHLIYSSLGVAMAMAKVVWMGNVPGRWSEEETIAYFASLGLPRATKIKLRCGGGPHKEQNGIAFFATEQVADM